MLIGQRAKAEREAQGRTAADVAKYAGLAPSTYYDFERGSQRSSAKLGLIAEYLGVSARWLETGRGPKQSMVYGGELEAGSGIGGLSRVPIVGTTQAGPDITWLEEERPPGYGDEYLDAPSKDPRAYALRVRGTSMSPRMREGEVIMVSPSTEPRAGDEVVVCLRNGDVMVKGLVYCRGNEVALDSINNDHPRIVRSLDDIEFMHIVVGVFRAGSIKQSVD